jgi:hypothetical protein
MIPVGMSVRIINEPVKVAWVDGQLLLEAHPPVDAEGQSFEPNVDQFAELLRAAVGEDTVAIHWDYAREVLQKADGVLATVGLEADLSALNPDSAATPTPTPTPSAATPASAEADLVPVPEPEPATKEGGRGEWLDIGQNVVEEWSNRGISAASPWHTQSSIM